MPRKIGLLHPGHKANFEVPLKALKKALPDDVDVDLKAAADLNHHWKDSRRFGPCRNLRIQQITGTCSGGRS